MSLEDKIRATAKDVDGSLEAAAGDLTGDQAMKAEGEAKHLQATVMGAACDLKDKAQAAAEAIGDAFQDLSRNGG